MTISLELSAKTIVLDRTNVTHAYDILYPFALEELLCRKMSTSMAPIVHLWRHPKAFVMGLRDSRLPQAAKADSWLRSQGYETGVRNSGGAAVPLDLGVINVSLLLPKPTGSMEHRKDFELMAQLIRDALMKLTDDVQKGEVAGSFCPGDFDLSIGGKKFCGIAQRRQQHATSVQAFVIVEGQGEQKAAVARAFYDRAAVGAEDADYPIVVPGSMASLAECLGKPLTSEDFIQGMKELLKAGGITAQIRSEELAGENEIQEMVELLENRYGIVRN
jgi:octanoyl-[GcvH]:protein N-octanoyltransferase